MVEKIVSSDKGVIYRIEESNAPYIEPYAEKEPSKVLKFGDRFICIFDRDIPEMTEEDLDELTHYSTREVQRKDGKIYDGSEQVWFLAISRQNDKAVLVTSSMGHLATEYQELWSFFQTYVPQEKMNMIFLDHNFRVDSLYSKNKDLSKYVYDMFGIIYVTNLTDSIISLDCNVTNRTGFAVISNRDTIFLEISSDHLEDSYLNLLPQESKEVFYSVSDTVHLKRITSSGSDNFDHILRDSVFYLYQKNDGIPKRQKLMFGDIKLITIYDQLNRWMNDDDDR